MTQITEALPGQKNILQKGFTLIEMIIYMALLSILLVIMTDIFAATISASLESESFSYVEQDARLILARLNYDILRSDTILSPGQLGSSSDNLTFTIQEDTLTYSLSNGDLILTDALGTAKLNSNKSLIQSLSFTKLGNSGGKEVIRAVITIKSLVNTPGGSDEPKTFTTATSRR